MNNKINLQDYPILINLIKKLLIFLVNNKYAMIILVNQIMIYQFKYNQKAIDNSNIEIYIKNDNYNN